MALKTLLSFGVVSALSLSQELFEPPDFDVAEALLANDVGASALPGLSAIAQNLSVSDRCSAACDSLQILFNDKIIARGASYDTFKTTYWSKQAATVDPACIFKPRDARDVSTAILLSRLTQCPFAIMGGGHTAFPGASSVEHGVTISMEAMKQVTLSDDKSTATIGPGNRWGHVYEKLGEQNLTVMGGRASEVGMGLVLGGGISHHINFRGLACDNVALYEVVTASGAILNVSPTEYPDLYWALRGGGNNFGIVTKFNLETIQQGPIWGGSRVYMSAQYPALINAFATMAENAASDPKGAHIISFASVAGNPIGSAQLEYVEPINEANPPSILKEYLSIPSIAGSTFNRSLANDSSILTSQMPGGRRFTFWAFTFKLDRDFMTWMQELSAKDISAVIPQTSITFQAFTVPALQQMSKKGGHALGLNPDDGPLFHILLYIVWDDASQDNTLYKAAQAPYHNVVPGYGDENLARLKAVTKKYNPKQVFQQLHPGGFKLEGAPYGDI